MPRENRHVSFGSLSPARAASLSARTSAFLRCERPSSLQMLPVNSKRSPSSPLIKHMRIGTDVRPFRCWQWLMGSHRRAAASRRRMQRRGARFVLGRDVGAVRQQQLHHLGAVRRRRGVQRGGAIRVRRLRVRRALHLHSQSATNVQSSGERVTRCGELELPSLPALSVCVGSCGNLKESPHAPTAVKRRLTPGRPSNSREVARTPELHGGSKKFDTGLETKQCWRHGVFHTLSQYLQQRVHRVDVAAGRRCVQRRPCRSGLRGVHVTAERLHEHDDGARLARLCRRRQRARRRHGRRVRGAAAGQPPVGAAAAVARPPLAPGVRAVVYERAPSPASVIRVALWNPSHRSRVVELGKSFQSSVQQGQPLFNANGKRLGGLACCSFGLSRGSFLNKPFANYGQSGKRPLWP